jgi:hypothetical protein
MNSKKITPADLSRVISDTLELYSEDVQKNVNKVGRKAVNELVRITKDTAPYNGKHHGRHFVDSITSKEVESSVTCSTFIWYVKPPDHRLTHLLVHGHMNRHGTGRVKGDPFLHNAWDKVRTQYEKEVEDVIKSGK